MSCEQGDDDDYEQLLDEAFRQVREEMAGQPVDLVLPALLARLEEQTPGRVPPLEFVVLLAEVISDRSPLTPATIRRSRKDL
jgi:hypothetical protein